MPFHVGRGNSVGVVALLARDVAGWEGCTAYPTDDVIVVREVGFALLAPEYFVGV